MPTRIPDHQIKLKMAVHLNNGRLIPYQYLNTHQPGNTNDIVKEIRIKVIFPHTKKNTTFPDRLLIQRTKPLPKCLLRIDGQWYQLDCLPLLF